MSFDKGSYHRYKSEPNDLYGNQARKASDSPQPTSAQSGRPMSDHHNRNVFRMNEFGFNPKWGKAGGDGGDCRRNFSTQLHKYENENMNMKASSESPGMPDNSNIGNSRGGIGLGGGGVSANNYGSVKSNWPHTRRRLVNGSGGLPLYKSRPDSEEEDDEDDNDTYERRVPMIPKFKKLSRTTDSPGSKHSSHSPNEEGLNDTESSYVNCSDIAVPDGKKAHNKYYEKIPNHVNWTSRGEINFIMLLGLIIGLIVSKALQYLQLYFNWFQNQVLQLRNAFLGPCSMWDFFNFDDNTRYGLRSKILLMPVIGTCSLLYGIVATLHFAVRFLLTEAPDGLITFIQNLYSR